MNRTLVIRPQAERDLNTAFRWYENVREGLGEKFLERVDAVFSSYR